MQRTAVVEVRTRNDTFTLEVDESEVDIAFGVVSAIRVIPLGDANYTQLLLCIRGYQNELETTVYVPLDNVEQLVLHVKGDEA